MSTENVVTPSTSSSSPPPTNESSESTSFNDECQDKADKNKPRKFKFPAHQSHMISLAKMCQDNKEYTDCVINCDNGEQLKAHRLVLGAASPFLKLVFQEVPQSLPEATIMVPGVKIQVVKALLDFLYTGEMTINREDTSDLQLLIDTLQINPELVSVQDDEMEEKPSSSSTDKESSKDSASSSATDKESSKDFSSSSNNKRKISNESPDEENDSKRSKNVEKEDEKKSKIE